VLGRRPCGPLSSVDLSSLKEEDANGHIFVFSPAFSRQSFFSASFGDVGDFERWRLLLNIQPPLVRAHAKALLFSTLFFDSPQ
jgi:hypothetical protein